MDCFTQLMRQRPQWSKLRVLESQALETGKQCRLNLSKPKINFDLALILNFIKVISSPVTPHQPCIQKGEHSGRIYNLKDQQFLCKVSGKQ